MSNAAEGVVTPDILTPPLSPYRLSDTLSPENDHPDSKYDNWTMRSFDCKTPLEDIPPWMRIYAESSIETHTFFKFERYEYQELNAWQSMLLKLYRKDLNKVIKYYEDYRVSLVSEICNRASQTPATESTETDGTRHEVCQMNPKEYPESRRDDLDPLTPPEEPKQERKVSEEVQVSKMISHFEKLDTSPPTTIDSPPQRQFKRFGKKKEVKGDEVETKERSEPVVSESSPDSHVFRAPDSPSVGSNNTGTGSTGDFDTPLLKRSPGKRMNKLRASYMHPSHYDQNISNNGDYPSPLHIRSASSRQTPRAQDFPSPYLNRSSSDRPKTMYTSMLQEGLSQSQSGTLSDWSSDEGGLFRRGSSKRSSGGVKILSPKLKRKSEPGSQRVKYIEPEASSKSKKLSKILSRATSFGRKDKEKSPRYKERKDERKSRSRSVDRARSTDRRTDRSTDRRKSDEQPRETAV